jgi:hypothetical protein
MELICMPTINVTGVGPIDLPEGLSQDEMAAAIDSHPTVQGYVSQKTQQAQHTNSTPWSWRDLIPSGTQYTDQPAMVDRTQHQTLDQAESLGELAKGVPGAGRYVPTTANMAREEAKHPIAAGVAQGIGGTLATAPLFAMTGPAKVAQAANALSEGAQAANVAGKAAPLVERSRALKYQAVCEWLQEHQQVFHCAAVPVANRGYKLSHFFGFGCNRYFRAQSLKFCIYAGDRVLIGTNSHFFAVTSCTFAGIALAGHCAAFFFEHRDASSATCK